jgi:UDPglucose--hexose-1-phosphate uridylyltransferase
MPELRQDPILGHWVIISEERGQRPASRAAPVPDAGGSECAFCPGNERETLAEIFAIREVDTAPDSPGWRVRVVPNKYPALRPDEPNEDERQGLFRRRSGWGHHEVIVEGEAHTRSVTELEVGRMREVVAVYRDRFRALARIPGLRSAVLIKNVGDAAGMSIEHSHSQLIATPVLPPVLEAELRAAREWASARDGGCPWCEMIRAEIESGERVVDVRGKLIAFCPWAARFPFETWILPLEHESHFELTNEACLGEFAELLPDVLRAIEGCLSTPPYNYAIHSAPFPSEPTLDYHWWLGILPRVTRVAGYEQSSGVYINHVRPEDAAAKLRRSLRPPAE